MRLRTNTQAATGRSTRGGLCALALALSACTAGAGERAEPDAPAAGHGDALAPVEAEPDAPAEGRGDEAEPATEDTPERFTHGELSLKLRPADCLLVAEFGGARVEHRFEFPAACHFVRTDAGQPMLVETDTGPALMVESSKPLAEGCDTALRVVVLGAEGPRLSRAAQRVQACGPGGWDEMMVHVLASEPVVFGTAAGEP